MITRLETYSHIKQNRDEKRSTLETELEKLKDAESVLAEKLMKLSKRSMDLAKSVMGLRTGLEVTRKRLTEEFEAKEGHFKDIIKDLENQINNHNTQLESATTDLKDKQDTEKRAAYLIEELAKEEELLMEQIADKEKEKVIETHKLTINISKKIEETKSALQDLKKEQLETTRRYSAVRQADRAAEQPAH